jgi:hypothetical protein
MDAKEKAEELFTTYRFALSIPNAPLGEYKDQIAKQCSLIAVEEIFINNTDEAKHNYWIEVKEEIEKL